ncbi:MAG TPA: hypothetical protein VKR58_12375 [Aquella sp.]|nr:hypothetical protein [Aquella sp.]
MLPPVLYEQCTANYNICLQQDILFNSGSSISAKLSVSNSYSTTSSTSKSLRRRS